MIIIITSMVVQCTPAVYIHLHQCKGTMRRHSLSSPSQFLVYFIYLAILTVIYLLSAAVVIIRHYRNRPGGGANGQAAPVELEPVAESTALAEEEPRLSNGQSGKV